MQPITIIVNSPPYGSEGPYNAFRLAAALCALGTGARLFLMADGVLSAKKGQKVPSGYYNTEKMLTELIEKGAEIRLCGTCCHARGITQEEVVPGAEIGGMVDLARWVQGSDKVISF